MTAARPAPFGQVLTAMVTPFHADGSLDLDGAQALALHLLANGHDGLVISGTTGESPTTSDEEKVALLQAVRDAVGSEVPLVAGVGTNDTRHSVQLARQAEKAGASGLLLVSPYYSRPPQDGVIAHVTAVADATELSVVLYDIPVRTGIAFTTETLLRVAEHPRVIGVKDAKADLAASAAVIRDTDLAWYSGDDALTLPLLSVGAVGTIGVITHLAGPQTRRMIQAHAAGDLATALRIHQQLLHLDLAIFRTQGVITVKAALRLLGLPSGPVRLPLVDLSPDGEQLLRADLAPAGVELP
jgi:4-hydroxy-tetrahydrodipicolinate synthase